MNIWQVLALSRNQENLTLGDAKRLYESRDLQAAGCRERFLNIMERRTDQTWLVCEASDLVFPSWQEAVTVGDSEDAVLFLPWLEDSGQDDYVYARHRRGDYGWCERDSTYYVDCDDEFITDQEYDYNYGICSSCERVFHRDDLYWNEYHENQYCESCDPGEPEAEEDEDEDPNPSGTIRSYHTDILDVIRVPLDRKTRYFGLEIEMEFPGETPSYWAGWAVDKHYDLADWAIWKSDGSLRNGAELVTIPATLDDWRGHNPIKALCNDQAFRCVAKSHNTHTCGLHIHVSRSTVPEPVIAKLQVLMNDPSMMETTTLVARRAPNTTYCSAQKKKWLSHTNYRWGQAVEEAKATGRRKPDPVRYVRSPCEISKTQLPQHGRYSPVNLTDKTLEFRIFRGTLRWETILASIEFCDATIWFAKQYGCADMNATAFNKFLRSTVTRKTYPALRDYLEMRTLLPKRKAKPDTMTACHSVPEVEAPRLVPDLNLDLDPYQGSRQPWLYATDVRVDYSNYPGDHFECDLEDMLDAGRRFVRLVDQHDDDLVIDCVNLSEINRGHIMWGPARNCSLRFN